MKFHIIIFGCQMNYADAARIKAVLIACGFLYTENIKEADIVIFDTCAIKQKSEDKISGKLKTIRPDQKIRITGCMIQHNLRQSKISNQKGAIKIGNFLGSIDKSNKQIIGLTTDEIKNFSPGTLSPIPINNAFNPLFYNFQKKRKNIELMRRIDDIGFLPLILKKIGYNITYDQEIINEYEKIIPENINTSMNKHNKTAYIPISTGCNQFCSYCIVPYARGLEKNFPLQQIVDEAKIHIKNGAKEIVLLGQIVNKHPEFTKIIKEILNLEGLKRLRYTSPYPTYYNKELLSLHETEEKLCPHIHIPLQSGSNNVLKNMLRGYNKEQSKKFIDDIKKIKRSDKSKISITTDIIVGFPDETEEDFQQTLDLINYGNFDMIYIGIYSPRPGTLAEKKYSDNIPYHIKHDRRNKLNELLKKISINNNKKEIGKIKTVLINSVNKGIIEGYSDNMKQIIIEHKAGNLKHEAKVGEFVQVKITKAVPFKLYGQIIQ